MRGMADPYNHPRFIAADLEWDRFEGPKVGAPCPDVRAQAPDGRMVALSDFRGRPVVMETGSLTSPAYLSHVRAMNEIARRHPAAAFLVLYVREPHPGRRLPALDSAPEKARRAQRLVTREHERRLVLVDDLQGSAHALLGGLPNSVHVVDSEGIVRFRAAWNDPAAVDAVVTALEAGQRAPLAWPRSRAVSPAAALRVAARAGWGAVADALRAAPGLVQRRARLVRAWHRPFKPA